MTALLKSTRCLNCHESSSLCSFYKASTAFQASTSALRIQARSCPAFSQGAPGGSHTALIDSLVLACGYRRHIERRSGHGAHSGGQAEDNQLCTAAVPDTSITTGVDNTMLSSHQASHRATCWHAPCQPVHSRSTAAVSPQCSCGQGRRLVQCAVNAGTLESAALALAAGDCAFLQTRASV